MLNSKLDELYKGIEFDSKVGYMTKSDVLKQISVLLDNITLHYYVVEEVENQLQKSIRNLESKNRTYSELCKIRKVLENEYIDQLPDEEVEEVEEKEETITYRQLQELSDIVADLRKKIPYEDVTVDNYNIIIYFPRTIKYVLNDKINEYSLLDDTCVLPKKIFDKIVDFYDSKHKTHYEEGEVIKFTDSQEIYKNYIGRITDNADYNNLTVKCYLIEGNRLIDMGFKDVSVKYNNVTKVKNDEDIKIINNMIDVLQFDDNNNIILMPDNTVDLSVQFKPVNHEITIVDDIDEDEFDDLMVKDDKGTYYTIDISMTKSSLLQVIREQVINRLLDYGTYTILDFDTEIAMIEIKEVK